MSFDADLEPSYRSSAEKRKALRVYEQCRKERTRMVVERGNVQQYLYHLHDGSEQEERDRKMRMVPTPAGEALAWRDPGLAPKLLGYNHIDDVCTVLFVQWSLLLTLHSQVDNNWSAEAEDTFQARL